MTQRDVLARHLTGAGEQLPRQLREQMTKAAYAAALTARQRELLGRYLAGATMRQLAAADGVQASTISRTISRALHNLRKLLDAAGGGRVDNLWIVNSSADAGSTGGSGAQAPEMPPEKLVKGG